MVCTEGVACSTSTAGAPKIAAERRGDTVDRLIEQGITVTGDQDAALCLHSSFSDPPSSRPHDHPIHPEKGHLFVSHHSRINLSK